MGFPPSAPISRPHLRNASVLAGAALIGLVCVTPTAAAPHPWQPAPVNSCGEIGFDPLAREAEPGSTPELLPPTIQIPVPVPEFVPVPIPGPRPDNTRIDPEPLPADPCANPCPDIRDAPKPNTPPPTTTPVPDGSQRSESTPPTTGEPNDVPPQTTTSTTPAPPAGIALPSIEFVPDPEPIPIPVPGGEGPEPQPAPDPVHVPPAPAPLAAPVAPPVVQGVRLVDQMTGPGSANRTDMRWQVDGTDLGVMWETRPGEVAVLFGDTFGKGWEPGGAGGADEDWRSNVLGFSTDRELSDGLTLDNFVQDTRCHAAELLSSRKIKNFETTTIPTSGFALGDRQYMTYMSISRWSRIPGMWWTNHGGIAWSDDNGRTWTKSQHAMWDNLFGIGRFQVATMVPHGDWVYMFGTPNGRMGVIGLARVPATEVLNKTAYQYWVAGNWVPASTQNELLATPLVLGTASELSIRYDQTSQRWQMVYLDAPAHRIVLRTAAEPQGTWTDPIPLVSTEDYPAAYGGFIHPWSTDRDLYFAMSAWGSYNVYLMHATLNQN